MDKKPFNASQHALALNDDASRTFMAACLTLMVKRKALRELTFMALTMESITRLQRLACLRACVTAANKTRLLA